MQVIILASGYGRRLLPLTKYYSKPMLPVANKPLLSYVVEKLKQLSDDIIIVVRKDQKDIINYFKNDVKFIFQSQVLGTGHALLCCEKYVKNTFLVMNADEFIKKDDLKLLLSKEPYTIAVFKHKKPWQFGLVKMKHNKIIGVDEKPDIEKEAYVTAGLYVLDKNIFPLLHSLKPSKRGEIELTAIFNKLESEPFYLSSWLTLTYPWDLLKINAHVLAGNNEIGKYCKISGNIKRSSIGNNCKILNSNIENSIVMDKCEIVNSNIRDSIICKNSVIENTTIKSSIFETKIKNRKVNTDIPFGAIITENKIIKEKLINPGTVI